jgi:hypothetical protein
MRCGFLFLILFALLTSETQAVAQSTTAAPDAANTAVPTLHVYSRLVLLDVTVTNANGKPIHGLTRSDFHIFDNNRPQTISSFEELLADQKARYENATPSPGAYSKRFWFTRRRYSILF